MATKFIEGEVCSLYPEHGTLRYASSGVCVACAKERAAAHQKAHTEKHRERQRRYAENNPDLTKHVSYATALRELANGETDVILFVASLFGQTVDKVLTDLKDFKRRNL